MHKALLTDFYLRVDKFFSKTYVHDFQIIENGDHVICAISGKKIPLKELTYWNVELQEAYFSPLEVDKSFKKLKKK